uniref:Glycosyl transferase family 25 domain-containing protein n=1 Tax=Florenciella parvula TaxID=236787 RepID=A0A7S2FD47_9STRA|mmetsp:Transcript_13705/g.28952  ORF Transcript_13705/g.28952 Transcript_13705/m.28952 type:complete len:308 (+) Transcript_13705:105-1028(+)|eukprot:CAMPEP_0182545866 /NCGR_PEP_ID=MMETSP1323-20130603/35149_1 /TAXON_ID=236787 /ORGANISM="Florenciella parvula, Strain RCC1693" /LENGTH=307 /DNA_ID=CAMNT_0024757047 /DNA_START=105 /DNA_END=1028 /DNA_ORIENTATION=-
MAAYVPPHRRRTEKAAAAAATGWAPAADPAAATRFVPQPRPRSAAADIFTGGAVVVNLKRRRDRMERFASTAHHALSGCEWSRFEAIDGATSEALADASFEARWDASRNAAYDRHCAPGPRRATNGERGCALSHIELWRKASALNEASWLLVCEDDCRFDANFDRELRRIWPLVPQDAELVYLGFSDRGPRAYDAGSENRVFTPAYGFATHCYAIRSSAASKFLAALPVAGPVDVWLADHGWFGACVRCTVIAGAGWRGTGSWLASQDQRPGDADVQQSSRDRPLEDEGGGVGGICAALQATSLDGD